MENVNDIINWLIDSTRKMFYIMHPLDLALDHTDDYPQYLLKSGIPMFFILVIIESIICKIFFNRKSNLYRINDLIACTVLGTFQQIGNIGMDLLFFYAELEIYIYVYNNYRIFEVSPKIYPYLTYFVLLFGKDFGYYWYHRFLHEFHLGWSAHSVHHSGEDYNLATGLRQGLLQPLFSPPFYCWLALLGFPPQSFSAHAQLNTLYMYWIHTDLVNRLPFGLEYIFNSPMAHRMHHRPPGNCNYAGLFIIWDRMFGSYEAELVRKDYYGLASQPPTFDPIKLNSQHFKRMKDIGNKNWFQKIFSTRNKSKRIFDLSLLFKEIPPLKDDVRNNGPVRVKWNGFKKMNNFTLFYIIIISIVSLVGMVFFLIESSQMYYLDSLIGCIISLLLLSSIARVCDQYEKESYLAMIFTLFLTPSLFLILFLKPMTIIIQ